MDMLPVKSELPDDCTSTSDFLEKLALTSEMNAMYDYVMVKTELDHQGSSFPKASEGFVKTEMVSESGYSSPGSEVIITRQEDVRAEVFPMPSAQDADVDMKPFDEVKDENWSVTSSTPGLNLEFYDDEENTESCVSKPSLPSGSGSKFKANVLEIKEGDDSTDVSETEENPPGCQTDKRAQFTCRTCRKTFTKITSLQRHMKIHRSERPYQCSECRMPFLTKFKLECHIRTHSGEKPFECSLCGKAFSVKSSLQLHMKFHNGEKPHECPDCGQAFTVKADLKRHIIRTHDKDMVNKPILFRETLNDSSSLPTQDIVHTEEKPPGCQNNKSKQVTCHTCQKTFAEIKSLQRHMKIHTGEKPYQCSLCGKAFSRPYELRQHVKTHTGEKIHKCPMCDKSFIAKTTLQRHIKTHSEDRPHKCQTCGAAFRHMYHLKYHARIHSDVKPYECHTCGKTFCRKFNLECHIQTHTGEKPFECYICKKAFATKSYLHKHFRCHNGYRPHGCPDCGRIFAEKFGLQRHILSTHSKDKVRENVSCVEAITDSSARQTLDKFTPDEKPLESHNDQNVPFTSGNMFAQKQDQQGHVQIHSKQKPYQCSICRKAFVRRYGVQRHMKSHTGENFILIFNLDGVAFAQTTSKN